MWTINFMVQPLRRWFKTGSVLWCMSFVLDRSMMTSSNGNIFHIIGPLCGEFPSQRPVTQSFDVFIDLRLNKRLRKQPWSWWFETPSCSLWRHCNDHRDSGDVRAFRYTETFYHKKRRLCVHVERYPRINETKWNRNKSIEYANINSRLEILMFHIGMFSD